MKVRHIYWSSRDTTYRTRTLEDRVNDFIKGKKVIDIKYSSSMAMCVDHRGKVSETEYSALIIYEDQ